MLTCSECKRDVDNGVYIGQESKYTCVACKKHLCVRCVTYDRVQGVLEQFCNGCSKGAPIRVPQQYIISGLC